MNFTELGINEALVEALKKENIVNPTEIQSATIPEISSGKDVYLSSETGTGKTLAFLLPLINKIDTSTKDLQAVVVVPTHELAVQIQQQVQRLTQNGKLDLRNQVIIGSTTVKRQVESLKKKPHLVIGVCGRMLELNRMKKLKMHLVKTLVFDEVDRLFTGKDLKDVQALIKTTLRDRQLIFSSATEKSETTDVAEKLSEKLAKIHTGSNKINEKIHHYFTVCEERDKVDTVRKLIHALEPERAMIFVHKNSMVETVAAKLRFHKLKVSDLHGEMDKKERKKSMDAIRSAKSQVLVSSDVAARGLDIKGVTHVINFDVPAKSKDYLHRVGRTGRAGAEGAAISIMIKDEVRLVRRFEREMGVKLQEIKLVKGRALIKS